MRKILVVLVPLLLCAFRAEAADVFFIESIRVSGVRFASEGAIVAESRLRPTRAYSEAQLGDAIHRIARLPFVRDADFRLARGSVRDTYILEILIEETRPLFYSFGHRRVRYDTEGIYQTANTDEAVVGARWFAGKNSMHVLVDGAGENYFQAGFTSYGVFNTSASVSLAVGYERPRIFVPPGIEVINPFRGTDNLIYNAVAVVPIAGNQAVRASHFQRTAFSPRTRLEEGKLRLDLRRYNYRSSEAAWVYNTTDDSLFPRKGTSITAGARVTHTATGGSRSADRVQTSNWFDQAGSFARYWPITQRQMVRAFGQAYTVVDGRDRAYELGGGWSFDFASPTRMRGDDLRFTITGRTLYQSSQERGTSTTLASSLAYRNKWGLLHLGLSYVKYRGID